MQKRDKGATVEFPASKLQHTVIETNYYPLHSGTHIVITKDTHYQLHIGLIGQFWETAIDTRLEESG